MKKRLSVFFPLLVIGLLLLGGIPVLASPAGPRGPEEIHLTAADNGGWVGIRGNQVLVVNLESNPSTGYGWEVQGFNQAVLRQVGREWVPSSRLLGAPGMTVLRFVGVGKGEVTLQMSYRRPWEKVAPARTFSIRVQVEDPRPDPALLAPEPTGDEPATAPSDGGGTTALPSAYNWCDYGACPPVRDQGACGSCWAFGTVGPFESALLIEGASRDLSEQYLVSCNVEGWGCNGGWFAHDYHEWKIPPGENAAGAVYESSFRYQAADVPCNGPYTHQEQIADWAYVGNDSSVPSVDAIKQAIYSHGPVAAAVCVDNAFQLYDGGIFAPRQKCNNINHAIVLVGWNDDGGYWILRNSWGSGWGENGYMRIAYGASKVGYAANYVVYGGGGPTPTPPPPSGSMHVSAIDMWYTPAGKQYQVYTRVTVVDEANAPVENATVSLRMTLPDGSTASGAGATGGDGTVTFSLRSKRTGTYTSEVTDVTHSTYTYNPADNLETSESLTVP